MVSDGDPTRNCGIARLVGMVESSKVGAGHLSVASGPRRYIYLGLAGLFFLLACVGVVLPGIPTTPFLILTSYFLIRSSPKLNQKLMGSKTFGPILRDWHEHRALRPRVKAVSLIASSSAVLLSMFFGGLPTAARVVVGLAGAYGIWFVWRLPVIRDQSDSG